MPLYLSLPAGCLNVYVWMCMSECVCLNVYVWMCMSECVCLNVYVWMCMSECVCLNVYVWMCMSAWCLNVYVWMCMSECVCLNVYVWMCMSAVCLNVYVWMCMSECVCLLACLPAIVKMPICLPACLLLDMPACLSACLPAIVKMPICLPACLPACYLICLPACLPACQPEVCLSVITTADGHHLLLWCLPAYLPACSSARSIFVCLFWQRLIAITYCYYSLRGVVWVHLHFCREESFHEEVSLRLGQCAVEVPWRRVPGGIGQVRPAHQREDLGIVIIIITTTSVISTIVIIDVIVVIISISTSTTTPSSSTSLSLSLIRYLMVLLFMCVFRVFVYVCERTIYYHNYFDGRCREDERAYDDVTCKQRVLCETVLLTWSRMSYFPWKLNLQKWPRT